MVASALEQTKISNEGPRYDAEYLKELKANTPGSRPRVALNEDPDDVDMSVDLVDVSMQILELETTGTVIEISPLSVPMMCLQRSA